MTSPELRQLFADPPPTFGPTPLWWWSGAEVTSERLRWQMQRFAAGGITNLVVINLAPAGPIFGGRADDPPWFSEQWWARFTETCETAAELGMKIWFYDQIGFSGANLQGAITHDHPEAAGLGLRYRTGRTVGGRVELVGQEQLVAAYVRDAAGGASRRLDLTGASTSAGPLLADASEVQLVTVVPTAYDYLNPGAVDRLLDRIHREFERRVPEHLGTVIAGSFQDELPATNTWTPAFAEEFRARRGYDLLDHLPALWRGEDDDALKVRGDYGSVRAELAEEALFKPLARWHEERGLLLGCDQFNPARAGFPTQATQLYADYFRTHRWYSAAGSDHEGDARVHSSMAHLYDHPRVWVESFHSSGWGGTLEDVYDWLLPFLLSGGNLYNPHATYFGTAGGWFEWAPPSTDWRQPYWQHYPDFARTVARLCSILSWGEHSSEVAVLYPTATAQALLPLDAPVEHFGDGQIGGAHAAVDQTQDHYLQLCGTNNWFETRVGLLDAAGIAFDVVDDDSLQDSELEVGAAPALRVRDHRFRTVLLPSVDVLETGTARQLTALLDAGGGVVLVGRPPRLAAGQQGDDHAVRKLVGHPRLLRVAEPTDVVSLLTGRADRADRAVGSVPAVGTGSGAASGRSARSDGSPEFASSDVPLLVRRSGRDGLAFVAGAFPNATRHPLRTGHWRPDDIHVDPTRYVAARTVTLRAPLISAEVWNPATGAQRSVPVHWTGASSVVEVPLEGAPAVLLVWREQEAGGPAEGTGERQVRPADDPAAAHLPARVEDLGTGWHGELVPTLDNRWGDLALPAGRSLEQLQVWSLDWSEGRDPDWTPVKVTSGQQVAVLSPVPGSERPAPLTGHAVSAALSGEASLVGPGFVVHTYSDSRGRPKDGGILGTKGMVAEEFLRFRAPAAGEVAVVRALVHTRRTGSTDLVVGAAATRRIWWNGVEVPAGEGYLSTAAVEAAAVNLLEIELGTSEQHPGFDFTAEGDLLGCFFALTRPGAFGVRPQFMTVGDGPQPAGQATYSAELEVPVSPVDARLVVGAATGLTIRVDGVDVARQEKVEYYESSWGATPMYFSHDLSNRLGAGRHVVEIVTESTDARDVVFVDLVVRTDDGAVCLVSGAGWATEAGGVTGRSAEHRGRWSDLAASHAAERSHPLPGTAWLHGAPVVGEPVDAVSVSVSAAAEPQRFRVLLPAGTTEVQLPLRHPAEVSFAGQPVVAEAGTVRLAEPHPEAAELLITTPETAVDRAGAAWDGPLLVSTAAAPIELGSWRHLGLRSWSGGVRYRRRVQVPSGARRAVLDLGRVRGSVDVHLDGALVGSAFCAPYRFELPSGSGELELAVTVYNTLAPFLDESTPTMWVYPSQLDSGLFGPVTLST